MFRGRSFSRWDSVFEEEPQRTWTKKELKLTYKLIKVAKLSFRPPRSGEGISNFKRSEQIASSSRLGRPDSVGLAITVV